MILSKAVVKQITSLHQKKFRRELNLFVAEGEKIVLDLLRSDWNITALYGTENYFHRNQNADYSKVGEVVIVDENDLRKISALTTPQQVLAVAEIKMAEEEINFRDGLKLVLDNISDPGNLGTLIRIADWFGIHEIICSTNTADCFNPKVVQSAMGSLFQTRIMYRDLSEISSANETNDRLPVFATVLDGKNIYEEQLSGNGFIVAGNESVGIDKSFERFITNKITVPRFEESKTDSLNVAVATAIVLSEFRRRS